MEKTENRDRYLTEVFVDIVNKFEIEDETGHKFDQFLERLSEHQFFQKYKDLLKNNNWTNKQKMTFILTELTKERSTCNAIIALLNQNEYSEIANSIEKYNKSLEPMPLVNEPEIKVTTVAHPKMTLTNTYPLSKKRRGICVIINNLEEQQKPDVYADGKVVFRPKGLENETKRLNNVFTQLYFEVVIKNKLDAKEIATELENIKKTMISDQDEAFALFVISHGQNERVLGYKACDYNRKMAFGEISRNNEQAIITMKQDTIATQDIIQIFNEKNCPKLKSKPKMHFFICCRVKSDNTPEKMEIDCEEPSPKKQALINNSRKRKQIKVNKESYFLQCIELNDPTVALLLDTFVIFTCAEGFDTFYDERDWGMTYFTQVLTVTIAQYACDEPLHQILPRTFKRLDEEYKQKLNEMETAKSQFEQRNHLNKHQLSVELQNKLDIYKESIKGFRLGCFAIEVRSFANSKVLHFHPGYYESLAI